MARGENMARKASQEADGGLGKAALSQALLPLFSSA